MNRMLRTLLKYDYVIFYFTAIVKGYAYLVTLKIVLMSNINRFFLLYRSI